MVTDRPRVYLKIEGPSDLISRWYPNGRLGGLKLSGVPPFPRGTRCELSVQDPKNRAFEVLGEVSWVRRDDSGATSEASFGIDFVEDDASLQRLMLFAQGKPRSIKNTGAKRLFTNLPVEISFQGKLRRERLFDLSEGGAFVQTRKPLPVGSIVDFRLPAVGTDERVAVVGRVMWSRTTGSPAGMGVQFHYGSPDHQTRIQKVIRKVLAAH
jgi:uncharacterized protein (TIGR02266 family)